MNGWRDIPGYEGLYQITEQGEVRSLDHVVKCGWGRTRTVRGLMIKRHALANGYLAVTLSRPSTGSQPATRQKFYCHRLVWETFRGSIPTGLVVMHLDDDRENPELSNLRIGTQGDNLADARSKGRLKGKRPEQCKRGHRFTAANTYTDSRGSRHCIKCRALRSEGYRKEAAAAPRPPRFKPGECRRGHLIGSLEDVLFTSFGTQLCRECSRENLRASRERRRATSNR